ncbi:MAG: hypothetical protein OXN84_02830 [Albidovulum sp.]|nr:hypothetical protein [Albidovulum sp.]
MSAVTLFAEIIKANAHEEIWLGSPLIGNRYVGNRNSGELEEEIVRHCVRSLGIDSGNGNRTSKTEMRVGYARF